MRAVRLHEDGGLRVERPVIDQVSPLSEAPGALAGLEDDHFGKLVLEI